MWISLELIEKSSLVSLTVRISILWILRKILSWSIWASKLFTFKHAIARPRLLRMCWREWVSVGFIGLGFTDSQLAISYWVQISFLRLSATIEEPFRLRCKPLEFKQDWLIDWWFTNFHLFLEHVAVNNLLTSVALVARLGLSVLNSILEITIVVFGDS